MSGAGPTRRALLVVLASPAFLVAACAAEPPDLPEAAYFPASVVLGTFRGEVDMESGVVTIRTDPAPSAGGRAAIGEITAVSVANAGTAARGNLCTGGGASLGVNVRISANPYVSTNLFTDVYAQIETLNGTGTEGCNSVAPPGGSGLSNAKGLWYYPSLGGSNGVTAYWAFSFSTGTKSTFTGKVYGTATTVPDIKVAFVTSTNTFDGALGGLTGANSADTKCQTLADAVEGSGKLPSGSTYRALLSTSGAGGVNAKDRIPDAAYVRPDGRILATSKSELFSTGPRVAIQITEAGTTYVPPVIGGSTQPAYVWTGTHWDGTVDASWLCTNWSTNGASNWGGVGDVTRFGTDKRWADMNDWTPPQGYSACNSPGKGLYCFQQ